MRLYNSNETNFTHNGLGILRDAITAVATEELNGMFELRIEYDCEGFLVDEIKEEMIIRAKANDKQDEQLFRIYSITKNHENDNLIIDAQHITYDLANNFVEYLKATSLTKKQVMEQIGTSTTEPHPFTVTSTNNTTQSSTSLYRTNPLQMIAGMEGSILQIWGGQIERDNFRLVMHDRRGSDDGVLVTYAKNLTGLNAVFDISGVITRIFPFVFIEATDESRERLITVNGKYVDSPLINDYEQVFIQPIDFSGDDRINTDGTDAQIRTQLTNLANRYFTETGNDKPTVEMEVKFEPLWETEEYKDLAVLELVGMGDTVTTRHSKLNVDVKAIVNRIEYDSIARKNIAVDLGNVKASLTNKVNKIDDIASNVDDASRKAQQAITSANGKNTTYYGPDEPTGNLKEGDLWFRVVDGVYTRTYRFDGIEWQLVVDMESNEAKELADEAKQDAQSAVDRANSATQQASNAIDRAQTAFDQAQDALGTASNAITQSTNAFNRANNAFDSVESLSTMVDENTGGLSTIKQSVIGIQTQVGDNAGNISTLTQIATGLQTQVSDAEGNISTLQQTATALTNRISDAEGNISTLHQTSQSFATRIEDAEGNVSTLTQTVQGLQTRVADTEGNISTVTQLATALQTRMTDAEGNISTLTQTSSSLVSRIDNLKIGGSNLLSDTDFSISGIDKLTYWDNIYSFSSYELDGGVYSRIYVPINASDAGTAKVRTPYNAKLNKDETYTFSFVCIERSLYIKPRTLWVLVSGGTNYSIDFDRRKIGITSTGYNIYKYESTFKHTQNENTIAMQISFEVNTNDSLWVAFNNLQLEEGEYATSYKPGYADAYSQISQLYDAINLRVKTDDLINQINIDTSGVLISGKRLILDGDTTVRGTFKVANANIISLDAGKLTTGILDAGQISVINLSANSIVGGIIQSQNSNIQFNLNDGTLDVNSSASIRFNGTGGGMKRVQNGSQAFVSYAVSQNYTTPLVSVGTLSTTGTVNVNDNSFRGIRIHSENVPYENDIIGDLWMFKRRVSGSEASFVVDLASARKSFYPRYISNFSYDLGGGSNYFDRVYAQNIRVNEGGFTVNNTHDTGQGYRFEVSYGGSNTMAFVGLNAGDYWINPRYYDLGKTTNRFNNLYLKYQPDVSSDERLKENIRENKLGLDFIKDIETKSYKLVNAHGRIEPTQYGLVAQQLIGVLNCHNIDVSQTNIITGNESTYYGVQYTQLIAPMIKSIQEVDIKFTDEVEFLKLKVQYLEQKIKLLEAA